MSFHETYEFFAIDRCLTPAEMRALRRVSTRATITPARFYNFYDWGGLKGDPREMLRCYFDLFVYTGNGRPYLGMLRFPADRVDRRRWRPYVTMQRGAAAAARAASLTTVGGVAILTVTPAEETTLWPAARERFARSLEVWSDSDEDVEDWREEEFLDEASWPVPLALVRADLLAGDLRPLYLLWLLSVQCGERRAATVAPPRPPGLALTGTLNAFAEFARLNADLLAVALEMPDAETATAGDLLHAARDRAVARRQKAAERAAEARRRRLAALDQRQEAEWHEIARLLDAPKVKPSVYNNAMRRLAALHELGVDRGRETAFRARLQGLVARYGHKSAFRERLRRAGLEASHESA